MDRIHLPVLYGGLLRKQPFLEDSTHNTTQRRENKPQYQQHKKPTYTSTVKKLKTSTMPPIITEKKGADIIHD
jgi:hypothetical protein